MLVALIQNNLVVGTADLTDEEIGYLGSRFEIIIDISDLTPTPQIGWAFDGNTVTGSSVSRKITRLAMRQRFTTEEMLGLMTYTNANPNSVVAMLMGNLNVATYVDLSRSDTQAGMSYLASQGLLTSDRVTTILTTVPTIDEIYQG